MNIFALLALLVLIYTYIVLIRIVIEMIQSFSRNYRPSRTFSIFAEYLFRITDPALKPLRRIIPPLTLGNVGLDISVIVLFFILQILRMVFLSLA